MAYMVLAAQFESFVQPIIILLSLAFFFHRRFWRSSSDRRTLNIFSSSAHSPDGAGEEKRDPARGLHEYASAERDDQEGSNPGSGSRKAEADSDDHFAMIFGCCPWPSGLEKERKPLSYGNRGDRGIYSLLFS